MWGIFVTSLTVILLGSVLCDFELLLLHNNDMHARFEETELNAGTCKPKHKKKSCIGGMARTAHEVKRHRQEAKDGKGPEVLWLNGGDSSVGTIWYTIFTYNITIKFVNALEFDAITLGNHEFDKGVPGLEPYVQTIQCPIVAANLDVSGLPALTNIKKSVVVTKGGKKIGIVGHVTGETKLISQPGPIIFNDEVEAVKEESQRLTKDGVDIIIILGHSGFLMDQRMAAEVPEADVVVGGHTNTFLWNGDAPSLENVEGPYPFVVQQESGKKVPVVQAFAYTKYLGKLNLKFDDKGDLVEFSGQPLLMESSIPQDEDILKLLSTYQPEIDQINHQIVGRATVDLEGGDTCRKEECTFGDLITDAMVTYKRTMSPEHAKGPIIALVNGGSIRYTISPLEHGEITRGDLLGALPFGNSIVTQTLTGEDIKKSLEIGVRSGGETSSGEFLQVSGMKVVYDLSKPVNSRVKSVEVKVGDGEYEDLVPTKRYTVMAPSFLALDGGDGHTILAKRGTDKMTEDLGDVDMMQWYFNNYGPVSPAIDGRIQFADSSSANQLHLSRIYTIRGRLILLSIAFTVLKY